MTNNRANLTLHSNVVGNRGSNFWLYDSKSGYDLTHPSTPDAPQVRQRIRISTSTAPITIAPRKTALIIIDMQNFFLGRRPTRGEGHKAEDVLLSTTIPAAQEAGIQVIHVTWGISDDELAVLPPTIFRIFGWKECGDDFTIPDLPGEHEKEEEKEKRCPTGVGDDIGDIKLPNGNIISAGRMLMHDQWNTGLHDPLQKDFEKSQGLALPHVRFHKARLSGFWGGSTPTIEFLKERNITTLLFAGVNTDQCVLACLQDANNMGFDTMLLRDACGTQSPEYARQMVDLNCRKSWGFVSSSKALADGVAELRKQETNGYD